MSDRRRRRRPMVLTISCPQCGARWDADADDTPPRELYDNYEGHEREQEEEGERSCQGCRRIVEELALRLARWQRRQRQPWERRTP